MVTIISVCLFNIWLIIVSAEALNSGTAAEAFRDNFDNGVLNESKWYIGDGISSFDTTDVHFSPFNVALHNGTLRLRIGNQLSAANSEEKKFPPTLLTSVMVHTGERFSFENVQVEIRAKLAAGNGTLSLISFHNPNCTIYERCDYDSNTPEFIVWGNKPTQLLCRLRYCRIKSVGDEFPDRPEYSRYIHRFQNSDEDLSLDYHIYKFIWTPLMVFWLLDDEPIFSFGNAGGRGPWPKLQIALSVLYNPQDANSAVKPLPVGLGEMSVDYVAVSPFPSDDLKLMMMLLMVQQYIFADAGDDLDWLRSQNAPGGTPGVPHSITWFNASGATIPVVSHNTTWAISSVADTVVTTLWWIFAFQILLWTFT